MVKGDFVFFTWYQQSPFLANPHGCQLREGMCSYVLPLHTRLHRQFNSFPGVFLFWTLSNLLLKLPDLHSQTWEASHTLLKWRLRSWTDGSWNRFHNMQAAAAFPMNSTRAPCSMDNRAPAKLPCCFSHYEDTVKNTVNTEWQKKNTNAKGKPTVYFQGWNNMPGCSWTGMEKIRQVQPLWFSLPSLKWQPKWGSQKLITGFRFRSTA